MSIFKKKEIANLNARVKLLENDLSKVIEISKTYLDTSIDLSEDLKEAKSRISGLESELHNIKFPNGELVFQHMLIGFYGSRATYKVDFIKNGKTIILGSKFKQRPISYALNNNTLLINFDDSGLLSSSTGMSTGIRRFELDFEKAIFTEVSVINAENRVFEFIEL